MIVLRVLAVSIVTVLLTGCLHRVAPPCGPPGSVQTMSDCYYLLEITKVINPTTGEVRAKVPQRIVESNQDKTSGFEFGGWFIRRIVGDKGSYSFFEYQFEIQNFDASKVAVNTEVDFHSVANQSALALGAPAGVTPMKRSKVENPCMPPGQTATQQCYYKLTITQIDATTGSAKGIVPSSVMENNAKLFPQLAAKVHRSPEYIFQVQDAKGLTQGSDYDFVSVPNTNVLQKCVKQQCEEFFPR